MCKRILVLNNMLNVLSLGAIAEKTIENVRTVVLDRVEVPMGRKQRSVSLQTGMGDFLSSVCLLAASCFSRWLVQTPLGSMVDASPTAMSPIKSRSSHV